MTYEETVQFVIDHPCHVVFLEDGRQIGKAFHPYLRATHYYYGQTLQDKDYFLIDKVGYRTVQKTLTRPMTQWKATILRASKGRTIPQFIQEQIERNKVRLDSSTND